MFVFNEIGEIILKTVSFESLTSNVHTMRKKLHGAFIDNIITIILNIY